MAIATAMLTSFKVELCKGTHDFTASTGNTFNMALIKATPTGTYNATSTAYTDITGNTDEATGTGYTAKGATLTNVTPVSSGTTCIIDWSDDPVQWDTTGGSLSADGCMIFDDTSTGDLGCGVWDFGGTKTASGGNFDVSFPTADASNAILRLA